MKINREQERKLKEWIRRLKPEQQFFLTKFTEMETEKALARVLNVVEISIFAALRETLPDLSTKEIINIIEVYVKEVEGNSKYINCREEEIKMIKEKELNAEKKTLELLNSGLDQKQIIQKLNAEFYNLTPSDIKNIYKRVKDEWVKPKAAITEVCRDYQLPTGKVKLKKEDVELLKETTPPAPKPTPPAAAKKQIVIEQKLEGLEIIDPIKVKFKGEVIVIGADFIECAEGKFDTIKDLEEYKDEEIKLFNQRIDNIKQVVKRFTL